MYVLTNVLALLGCTLAAVALKTGDRPMAVALLVSSLINLLLASALLTS